MFHTHTGTPYCFHRLTVWCKRFKVVHFFFIYILFGIIDFCFQQATIWCDLKKTPPLIHNIKVKYKLKWHSDKKVLTMIMTSQWKNKQMNGKYLITGFDIYSVLVLATGFDTLKASLHGKASCINLVVSSKMLPCVRCNYIKFKPPRNHLSRVSLFYTVSCMRLFFL